MGWFSKELVDPIEAVGGVLDNLFTSDEERLDKEVIKQRLAMQPSMAQAKINEVSASHRSVFVAGARPALLWVCAGGYAFAFLINPIVQWISGSPGPVLPMDYIAELTFGMLGLAGLRTVEKLKGKAK
jgi:hypothetical protein